MKVKTFSKEILKDTFKHGNILSDGGSKNE